MILSMFSEVYLLLKHTRPRSLTRAGTAKAAHWVGKSCSEIFLDPALASTLAQSTLH